MTNTTSSRPAAVPSGEGAQHVQPSRPGRALLPLRVEGGGNGPDGPRRAPRPAISMREMGLDGGVAVGPSAGENRLLGIYAKSPSLLGQETYNPGLARLERFSLQSVVRHVLPGGRTAKCLRVRRRTSEGQEASISVWRSVEFESAHYKGLQTCGSVWACPVCSAKISERRRIELAAAIAMHKAAGAMSCC